MPFVATVSGRAGCWWLLRRTGRAETVRARRAASCLLEPRCGDAVCVVAAAGSDGEAPCCYLVAVLSPRQDGVLDLPGGASIACEDGGIDLTAQTMRARVGRLEWVGESIAAAVGEMTTTAATWLLRARDCLRMVARTDATRAARAIVAVRDELELSGDAVRLQGERRVKIDAQQIDVG